MFERKKQAGKIYFLPIDQIRPSPFQARREFSEQELAALAQSIRENGLLQPISVRKVSDGGYELVAGERRLRACRLAKMNTIPAILCDYDDERTAALGLLENIQTKLERLAEDNRPLFNGERFLSDKELSDLLRISRRCLQDYRDQGRISYIRLGGKILYKVSDIEKLLEDNYHEALI